jgi:hypothetical protein
MTACGDYFAEKSLIKLKNDFSPGRRDEFLFYWSRLKEDIEMYQGHCSKVWSVETRYAKFYETTFGGN